MIQRELLAPYPWHGVQWQALDALLKAGTLPHALLFAGAPDIGKFHFARAFASRVLCAEPHGNACGRCRNCQLIAAGSHPDLVLVQPEERGKAIRIDAIRELREFCAGRPHQGGWRVILIEPAEALNANAANALLKTLEEPGERTLLLLVSHQPGRLTATVRSRCRLLRLPTPSIEQALPWLRIQLPGATDAESLLVRAGRRPLRALALVSGAMAETFARVQELVTSVADGSVVPAAAAAVSASAHFDTAEALGWIADFVAARVRAAIARGERPPQPLFDFFDRLAVVRREHAANANLNAELVWAGLWQDWRRTVVAGG
ncbi:MAG: DNA polymerase III subunit delta' [Porticoccaceae bacterium]